METINKLNEIINQKADIKLKEHIRKIRLCDIDGMDIDIEIPEEAGYICCEDTGRKRVGMRFISGDEFLKLLKQTLYNKLLENFQNRERSTFLNDLQQLRDYLRENTEQHI